MCFIGGSRIGIRSESSLDVILSFAFASGRVPASVCAIPGLADSPWATRSRPLRGLRLPRVLRFRRIYPGLADSPWAVRCRLLRGLVLYGRGLRFIGLDAQGSQTRSWATCCRRCAGSSRCRWARPQGSRSRPGLHAVTCCAGSSGVGVRDPRARGLALGHTLSPVQESVGINLGSNRFHG